MLISSCSSVPSVVVKTEPTQRISIQRLVVDHFEVDHLKKKKKNVLKLLFSEDLTNRLYALDKFTLIDGQQFEVLLANAELDRDKGFLARLFTKSEIPADAVLTGRIGLFQGKVSERQKSKIAVNVQLARVSDGTILWTSAVSGEYDEVINGICQVMERYF